MNTVLKIALHAALFIVAFFIFFLGLGVGLALSPALGTLLWFVAGATIVGNIAWIVIRFRRRSNLTHTV